MHDAATVSNLKPFPPLPLELVRTLLELAAENKATALALAGLSRAVHRWVKPIIYHTVILIGRQIRDFHRTLQITTTNPAPNALVHGLWIQDCFPRFYERLVPEIILYCTHLERLSTDVTIDLTRPPYTTTAAATPWPSPFHLALKRAAVNPLIPGHPLLRNLTHLYFDAITLIVSIPFSLLPNLTHVCVGPVDDTEAMLYGYEIGRLLLLRSLCVLLVLAYDDRRALEGPGWSGLAGFEDERLLVMPEQSWKEDVALFGSAGTVWDEALVRYAGWRGLVTFEAG